VSVKPIAASGRVVDAHAGLERIKTLERQLAAAPIKSLRHRTLTAAIRIEADAYRKYLDFEQATATHDTKSRPGRPSEEIANGRVDKANS
jgi:hypothetical protein